jgi:hypothetical protein
MNTSINLNVPVQIAVESTYDQIDDDELPSFDAAIAEAEQGDVDVHMAPRLMHEVSSARFQNHSILPSYEDMRMRHPVAAA